MFVELVQWSQEEIYEWVTVIESPDWTASQQLSGLRCWVSLEIAH